MTYMVCLYQQSAAAALQLPLLQMRNYYPGTWPVTSSVLMAGRT